MDSIEYYERFHQKYLGIVSGRGALKLEDAKQLYRDLIIEMPDFAELAFENLIDQINHRMIILMKKLVVVKSEFTGDEYLVLILSTSCPELKHQTLFHQSDLKYFESIIKAILDSSEYCIGYNSALSLNFDTRRKSVLSSNEKLLEQLITLLYLQKINGKLYLGPKTLAEYKNYIQHNFKDLHTCQLCLNVTFVKNTCPYCNVSFHKDCIKRFWETDKSCPNCRSEWIP